MVTLATWIKYAEEHGIKLYELPFAHSDGLCYGNHIGLRKGMTEAEKTCTLAEEIGHHLFTVGNILDQSKTENRKQEHKARRWAYNKQIEQSDLIAAVKNGYRNSFDIAEYLGVTEAFLNEAIEDFRKQYGVGVVVGDCFLQYEPYLAAYEMNEEIQ